MARADRVKRGIGDLKRGIKRAVADVRAKADERRGRGGHRINVASRANLVVASNVGEDGSVRRASSSQHVRIRQNGEETIEDTQTTP